MFGSGFSDNGEGRVAVDTVRLNGEFVDGSGFSDSGSDRVAVDSVRLNGEDFVGVSGTDA